MKKLVTLLIVAAITAITATTAFAQPKVVPALVNSIESINELEKEFPELTAVFHQVKDAIVECIKVQPVRQTPAPAPAPALTEVEKKVYETAAYTQLTADIIMDSLKPAQPAPQNPAPEPVDPNVQRYLNEANYWLARANAFLN